MAPLKREERCSVRTKIRDQDQSDQDPRSRPIRPRSEIKANQTKIGGGGGIVIKLRVLTSGSWERSRRVVEFREIERAKRDRHDGPLESLAGREGIENSCKVGVACTDLQLD
jgi:hypothetical protein